VSTFAETYHEYVETIGDCRGSFGFELETIKQIEPALYFLYHLWWRVKFRGLERIPKSGPALIVGNVGGGLPWPMLMLLYALMNNDSWARRLNILADLDWIDDERMYNFLIGLGFVSWSSANAKRLFADGELVAVYPEGTPGLSKTFTERYRLKEFDWTKLLPAVEENIPIYPLATAGCDEAVPVLGNLTKLAKSLRLPAFPITPFFPWLPFPASLMSLPVSWQMHILKPTALESSEVDELAAKELTRKLAQRAEGEIQAELNRMLRSRFRAI
jgi:1-acyl-sn-glycerol-3-phosphate acyltransferase